MRMRRATWLFPCWMACTSASPPPDAAASTKQAEVAPEATPTAAPICELGTTRPCYPGPEATAGVGACKAGVETCGATGFGACTGAVVPAAEEDCRTPYDEDCDGRIDDCPEVEVALAIAFTSDHALTLADWGGGLGIMQGSRFWVVEPGGRVVDVREDEEPAQEPWMELDSEADGAESVDMGGAWPGALVRSYEIAAGRAGSITHQERWDGSSFSGMESPDELLQQRYDDPVPWRDGHAIALRYTFASYEATEQLDEGMGEYGSITAAERRALQRKVNRMVAKAKPRLEILAAEQMFAWEPSYGVFTALEVENGDGEEAAEPTADDMASAVEPPSPTAETEGVKGDDDEDEDEVVPKLPQPPALPDELLSFVVLSDGTVAMLGRGSGVWSWKPGQRRWTVVEPPAGSTRFAREQGLHAGPEGELLLRDCDVQQATGTLRRRSDDGWVDVPLPTAACPTALATGSDRTRWMISGGQLWQRRSGDAEPWARVSLPSPWKPRQLVVFDGQLWIAAEDEGGKWAVLVDRPVPMARALPPK